MQTRHSAIRAAARERNLDGLIGWRTEELVMMTGCQPHWGLSVCWFPIEGDPVLHIPELEPRDILPEGFQIRTFPWGVMTADPWRELSIHLASDIGSLRAGRRHGMTQTALPGASAEMPPWPSDFESRLPGVDASGIIDSLLAVKTAEEIACIRLANAVAQKGLDVFFDSLQPGRTEAELAATAELTIHSQTGKDGVLQARGWAFVQSGPNTAFTGQFNRSSGRKLEPGDLVTIELATCVNGYWSDLTRTGIVGPLSPEHRRIFETVRRAQEAALSAVRPGVPAGSIDKSAREVVNASGFGDHFRHATGHPVGFRYHDAGPVLAPGGEMLLEPGMVLTIEPGIYGVDLGGGCRIEENVAVTCDGVEMLSQPQPVL